MFPQSYPQANAFKTMSELPRFPFPSRFPEAGNANPHHAQQGVSLFPMCNMGNGKRLLCLREMAIQVSSSKSTQMKSYPQAMSRIEIFND